MFRHTRATTVVSHPVKFWTSLVSARLTRSQASCTASSASADDPSMRYATARRWGRFCWNRWANQSRSLAWIGPSRKRSSLCLSARSLMSHSFARAGHEL
jgi:hypothetical protein